MFKCFKYEHRCFWMFGRKQVYDHFIWSLWFWGLYNHFDFVKKLIAEVLMSLAFLRLLKYIDKKKDDNRFLSRWLWWTPLCSEEEKGQMSLRRRKLWCSWLRSIFWSSICQSVCLQKLGQIQNLINSSSHKLLHHWKSKKRQTIYSRTDQISMKTKFETTFKNKLPKMKTKFKNKEIKTKQPRKNLIFKKK